MTVRTFLLRTRFDVEAACRVLRAQWKSYADAGRPLAIEVHEQRDRRTAAQNRFYWALLGDIADEAWIDDRQYDAETWHAFFAGKFIGWHELPRGGRAPISTTTLDVAEFQSYLERVQAFAAMELGMELEAA